MKTHSLGFKTAANSVWTAATQLYQENRKKTTCMPQTMFLNLREEPGRTGEQAGRTAEPYLRQQPQTPKLFDTVD
jgi:hypothetical protein